MIEFHGWVAIARAVLLVASFLGALVFTLLYHQVSRWRATPLGRHMLWFSVMMTSLTGLAVLSVFLHDYPGRAYVSLGAWTFLAFMLWQRVWLLLKAFQEGPAGRHRAAVAANEAETERLIQEGEDG